MARRFNGNPDRLTNSAPVITAPPWSCCGWFYNRSLSQTSILLSIEDDANVNYHMVFASSAGEFRARAAPSGDPDFGVAGLATDRWQFFAYRVENSVNRFLFLDGNTASQNTAFTTTGLVRTGVGFINRGGAALYSTADIAHLCVWRNYVLSTEEMQRIWNAGLGQNPQIVAPQNIAAYWPLVGDDQDYANTLGNHPYRLSDTVNANRFPLTVGGNPFFVHEAVLLKAPKLYVPTVIGAAPVPTVEPVDAEQQQQATSPTIEHIHELVVSDAEQPQQATSPTLQDIPSDTINVTDAEQPQQATSPTIEHIHNLGVTDAEQPQQATSPTIFDVPPGAVVVQSAEQEQIATQPLLTQIHNLVVNSSIQHQEATSPIITPLIAGATTYWTPVIGSMKSWHTPIKGDL